METDTRKEAKKVALTIKSNSEMLSVLMDKVAGPTVPMRIRTLPGKLIKVNARPADEIISYTLERYSTGDWHWIRNSYWDGGRGKCLYQALCDASLALGYGPNETSLAIARVQSVIRCVDIPRWNDRTERMFSDVRDALEMALVGVKRS